MSPKGSKTNFNYTQVGPKKDPSETQTGPRRNSRAPKAINEPQMEHTNPKQTSGRLHVEVGSQLDPTSFKQYPSRTKAGLKWGPRWTQIGSKWDSSETKAGPKQCSCRTYAGPKHKEDLNRLHFYSN